METGTTFCFGCFGRIDAFLNNSYLLEVIHSLAVLGYSYGPAKCDMKIILATRKARF